MSGPTRAVAGAGILVTGSSTGLGLETSLYLAERGFRVYASVRNADDAPAVLEQARSRNVTLDVVELDVTEPASIDSAVEAIVADAGGIFGLVNNAGIALRGCVEDLTDDEVPPGSRPT